MLYVNQNVYHLILPNIALHLGFEFLFHYNFKAINSQGEKSNLQVCIIAQM